MWQISVARVLSCTNQQPPQHGGAVPDPFGLGRNGGWPSQESQLTRALPFIFSLCCSLNDCIRAAHSFFKIGCLSSIFSCLSPDRLCFLILLLLMSNNVHPNRGPIFTSSVCAGNVTWRNKSVQCCTCSKWVHLRSSQLSLSKFSTLGPLHRSLLYHCDFFPGLLRRVYLRCLIWPLIC